MADSWGGDGVARCYANHFPKLVWWNTRNHLPSQESVFYMCWLKGWHRYVAVSVFCLPLWSYHTAALTICVHGAGFFFSCVWLVLPSKPNGLRGRALNSTDPYPPPTWTVISTRYPGVLSRYIITGDPCFKKWSVMVWAITGLSKLVIKDMWINQIILTACQLSIVLHPELSQSFWPM